MTKLVISSTEVGGGYLGQYECAGEHNGAPYYRQTGDNDEVPLYLYRDPQTAWRAGLELGSTEDGDCGLYHPPTTGDTPPQSGGTRGWRLERCSHHRHHINPVIGQRKTLEIRERKLRKFVESVSCICLLTLIVRGSQNPKTLPIEFLVKKWSILNI